MKTVLLFLLTTLAWTPWAAATLVSVVTRANYRSLADSPWREAITAGEALKHVPFEGGTPEFPSTYYNPATTLADGLGFLDNFEDDDDYSPFVQFDKKEVYKTVTHEFFGIYQSSQLTSGDNFAHQRPELPVTFIPTEDGKFPLWFGFAIFPPRPGTLMEIAGVDGWLQTINLFDIANALPTPGFEAYPFMGFIFDSPVKSILIYGTTSEGGGLVD